MLARPLELVPSLAIVAAVLAVALIARVAVDIHSSWYESLRRPNWQPPDGMFTIASIVALAGFTASALLAWHNTGGPHRTSLMVLYTLNAALGGAWGFILFSSRSPLVAAIDATGLVVAIIWLMVRVVPISPLASLVLLPCLVWAGFVAALSWSTARMN